MFRSLVRDYVLRSERRRLRATLRWIKRAECFYIKNHVNCRWLGMCSCFLSTCPWWLSCSHPYHSNILSLLSMLCPEFNEVNLTSRFPTGINNHSELTGFWWMLHMTKPRLDSFVYLKDLYSQKLKLTYV